MRMLNRSAKNAKPRGVNGRFKHIHGLLTGNVSDMICLTEAYPETSPLRRHTTSSARFGWGKRVRPGER